MSTFSYIVEDPDGEGSLQRLDKYLAARQELKGVSRSNLQEVISLGRVAVNGVRRAKPSFRLKPGVRVVVDLDNASSQEDVAAASNLIQGGDGLSLLDKLEMANAGGRRDYSKYVLEEDIPLDVVYEDDALLVVNKPRGMAVHASVETNARFQGTLVNALLHHCKGRQGLSSAEDTEGYRPGIVHRIDMNTSGLLVAAKTDSAHALLKKQFMVHSIQRTYLCLCHGWLAEDTGTVATVLGKDPMARARQAVQREITDEEVDAFLADRHSLQPLHSNNKEATPTEAGQVEPSAKESEAEAGIVAISRFSVLGRFLVPVIGKEGKVAEQYVDQVQKKAPLSKKQRRRMAKETEDVANALPGALTLVEMKLETGRTHQIRAHMHYLGHSLLFDPLYRKNYKAPPASGRAAVAPPTVFTPEEMFLLRSGDNYDTAARDTWSGQLLHAASLAFRHPLSGEKVSFSSEPAEPFRTALQLLQEHKR